MRKGKAKFTQEEAISKYNGYGLVLIDEYENANHKHTCMDSSGYYIKQAISKPLRNITTKRFSVSNPYMLYNIELFIKLNNKKFKLLPNQSINKLREFSYKCDICNHIFKKDLAHILVGNGCPSCAGSIVTAENCITKVRPDLIEYFINPDDANTVTRGSEKIMNLKCPNCGQPKNLNMNNLTLKGFSCSHCSDGISMPEKFGLSVLNQTGINFKRQKKFSWSNNYKYDFYFEKNGKKYIIETHGLQHYEKWNFCKLSDIQTNDENKMNLAMNNHIDFYIIIDCRYTEFEWLKENFIKELSSVLDLSNIDFLKAFKDSNNSLLIKCANLWESGLSITEISKELNIARSTVRKYLKRAKILNMCDYSEDIGKRNINYRSVYSYDAENGMFLSEFKNVEDAHNEYKVPYNTIRAHCINEVLNTTNKYLFRYYKTDCLYNRIQKGA